MICCCPFLLYTIYGSLFQPQANIYKLISLFLSHDSEFISHKCDYPDGCVLNVPSLVTLEQTKAVSHMLN